MLIIYFLLQFFLLVWHEPVFAGPVWFPAAAVEEVSLHKTFPAKFESRDAINNGTAVEVISPGVPDQNCPDGLTRRKTDCGQGPHKLRPIPSGRLFQSQERSIHKTEDEEFRPATGVPLPGDNPISRTPQLATLDEHSTGNRSPPTLKRPVFGFKPPRTSSVITVGTRTTLWPGATLPTVTEEVSMSNTGHISATTAVKGAATISNGQVTGTADIGISKLKDMETPDIYVPHSSPPPPPPPPAPTPSPAPKPDAALGQNPGFVPILASNSDSTPAPNPERVPNPGQESYSPSSSSPILPSSVSSKPLHPSTSRVSSLKHASSPSLHSSTQPHRKSSLTTSQPPKHSSTSLSSSRLKTETRPSPSATQSDRRTKETNTASPSSGEKKGSGEVTSRVRIYYVLVFVVVGAGIAL